ncbi:choice-of-anchor M domain-containing protein [Rothia uropygioeca]|uniref:choice-of-anchor M domain-containing protein n=1 Tax=Kocuria sp. 257 TaxID=2021970 RepID=UPI0013EDE984|nr:choice-of-anchor M domain-containing protein [Kocuria sp. 257]
MKESTRTSRTAKPWRRGTQWVTACFAVLALALGSTPAWAGPDDGRTVTTRAHVDAPKTYWKNGHFTLFNEYRGQELPLESTVAWVGKGWNRSGKNQYQFTVPDSPNLDFLKGAGKTWYMAPGLPINNHDPIWMGFGADTDIPVEKFRDKSFFLDLLSVDGPGRVEMLKYTADNYPQDVVRLLSSSDEGWHFQRLVPGRHTHNETLYSRPGRYELTYRTVARGTDGSTIQSKPTTMVVQVGGRKPLEGATAPLKESFDKASDAGLDTANYRLAVSPHAGEKNDGDEKLSTISFEAGKPVEGTLTLYNQGYFLTDLPVENGKASWDELMGFEDSSLQGIFVPKDGSAPRWISPELKYAPGKQAHVSSDQGHGDWPDKHPDPANTASPTKRHTPERTDYTIELTPVEEYGHTKVTVRFKDPKFRGVVTGGIYDNADSKHPTSTFETQVTDGVGTAFYETDFIEESSVFRSTVTPHPDMNAFADARLLEGPVTKDKPQSITGSLTLDQSSDTDSPQPEPSASAPPTVAPGPYPSDRPGDPKPKEPSNDDKCVDPDLDRRLALDDGHVDIVGKGSSNGLSIALSDETGQHSKGTVERNLNDVKFMVSNHARHKRNGSAMKDPALDFIGPEGSEFYGLSQTQSPGIIWPGYNTQGIDFPTFDQNGVNLTIKPTQMPKDAHFGMFSDGNLGGKVNVMLDSTKNKTDINITYGTHAHANWVFTKPGVYSFDVSYSGKSRGGTSVRSDTQNLRVVVGNPTGDQCGTGSTGTGAGSGYDHKTDNTHGKDAEGQPDSDHSGSHTDHHGGASSGDGGKSNLGTNGDGMHNGGSDSEGSGNSGSGSGTRVSGSVVSPGPQTSLGRAAGIPLTTANTSDPAMHAGSSHVFDSESGTSLPEGHGESEDHGIANGHLFGSRPPHGPSAQAGGSLAKTGTSINIPRAVTICTLLLGSTLVAVTAYRRRQNARTDAET